MQTLVPAAIATQVCWSAQVHCHFLGENSRKFFFPRWPPFVLLSCSLLNLQLVHQDFCGQTRGKLTKVISSVFFCFVLSLFCILSMHYSIILLARTSSLCLQWWHPCCYKVIQFHQKQKSEAESVMQVLVSCNTLMPYRCLSSVANIAIPLIVPIVSDT